MSRPTAVCIVASPRPRTGRTTLARALTEFYRTDAGSVIAYDLDALDATLQQFLPDCTVRADVGETQSQVKLFDQLIVADGTPKVVDVSAPAFEAFFNLMAEIDFAGEARRQGIEPVVLFAASPDALSVKTYTRTRARFWSIPIAPVYNDGLVRGHNLRDEFPALTSVALPVHVPALSPALRTVVDTKPFSLADASGRPKRIPETLDAELGSWVKRLNLQFREMALRMLLANLRGSLTDALPQPPVTRVRPPA